ncbi:MAG: hypothetical protein L6Q68_17335 [Aquabacterium sp.]|nr:hypothetical protein [Aquabacterium sp.]
MNEFETGLEWLARAVATLASWAAAGTLALALVGAAAALLAQWLGAVLPRRAAGAPWAAGQRRWLRASPQHGPIARSGAAPGRAGGATGRSPRGGRCASGQVCAA